jgi:hypothetical protein
MSARSVRHLLAVAAALGAVALLPTAAAAHPEACLGNVAFNQVLSGASPWDSWSEAVKENCASEAVISNYDDSGAQLAEGETGTRNLRLLSNTPKEPPLETEGDLNSDLAFEDGYAYQGNYDGFVVWDVRKPGRPKIVSQVHCPGSQNDVTVNDGILVTSTDSRRTDDSCVSTTAAPNWEGLKVWDVRDPRNPRYVKSVRTDCGSHTHTVLPERERLLIYVQSYDIGAGRPNCEGPHDQISIVEIPRNNLAASQVIAEPVLFPDGGNPGEPGGTERATTGCHDITVYQDRDIAAGACTGQGVILDISDPEAPEVLSSVEDPNFAFWHSATISHDGKKVLFTDEKGGGSLPECNPTTGPNRGADAVYDIHDPANPKFISYWKIPRDQTNTENCVAHNGNLIPVKGRDVMVQAWYQGGISIIDWTNPRNIRELAYFDRGPLDETRLILGGSWSAYFYNGLIYSSEIQRGFDVFAFLDPLALRALKNRTGTLNAQTQERVR